MALSSHNINSFIENKRVNVNGRMEEKNDKQTRSLFRVIELCLTLYGSC